MRFSNTNAENTLRVNKIYCVFPDILKNTNCPILLSNILGNFLILFVFEVIYWIFIRT